MRKSIFSYVLLLASLAITLFSSCEQDSDLSASVTEVDNYVDQSMFELQRSANSGRFGCAELIFPVAIELPDGSATEVDSYEELGETIRTWKSENPGAEERPQLAFPLEVVTQEGEVLSIEDRVGLFRLRQACRRSFFDQHGHRGHRGRPQFCFALVYPVDIALPASDTITADDRETLKLTLRNWRKENRGSSERPQLVFPIEVQYEDGSIASIEDKDALLALKETCSAEADEE